MLLVLVPFGSSVQQIHHIAYYSDFEVEDTGSILTLMPSVKSIEGVVTCVHVRGKDAFWSKTQREFFDRLYDLSQRTCQIQFKILQGQGVKETLATNLKSAEINALALRPIVDNGSKGGHPKGVIHQLASELRISMIAFQAKPRL